jgi:hypothetical protein
MQIELHHMKIGPLRAAALKTAAMDVDTKGRQRGAKPLGYCITCDAVSIGRFDYQPADAVLRNST